MIVSETRCTKPTYHRTACQRAIYTCVMGKTKGNLLKYAKQCKSKLKGSKISLLPKRKERLSVLEKYL